MVKPAVAEWINRIYKDDLSQTIVTLVSGLINMTTAIAADEAFVYFYDDQNNIKTVPAMGGAVATIGDGVASSLYISGNDIYWTEYSNGMIKKMPKTGGAVTTLATGSNSPSNLVVYDSTVYWLEFTNPGRVLKASVNGGSTTVIAYEANTIGIATDSANIYWAVSVFLNQGKIQKLGLATGSELHNSGSSDNVSIIPNPANNSFRVSFAPANTSSYPVVSLSNYHLTVYSVLGALIYSETLENIAGKYSKEIELENVQSGIYFVYLKSEHETIVKKLLFEK